MAHLEQEPPLKDLSSLGDDDDDEVIIHSCLEQVRQSPPHKFRPLSARCRNHYHLTTR